MRRLATLPEDQAAVFAAYLAERGIATENEPAAEEGRRLLWVLDEDSLATAKALLSRYRSMPDAEEFSRPALEKAARASAQKAAAKPLPLSHAPAPRASRREPRLSRMPWGTMAVVALAVAATWWTGMGKLVARTAMLQITSFPGLGGGIGFDPLSWLAALPEVRHGEIWRLWTPVLLHFDFWHILFNAWWLKDLGGIVESREGTGKFLVLVFVTGIASNLAQFAWAGAAFGGLSGVVYAFFGYIWLRGRTEPLYGTWMPPSTTGLLLVWLVMGMAGLTGPTANAAHFSGLLVGAAWGAAEGALATRRHRRRR